MESVSRLFADPGPANRRASNAKPQRCPLRRQRVCCRRHLRRTTAPIFTAVCRLGCWRSTTAAQFGRNWNSQFKAVAQRGRFGCRWQYHRPISDPARPGDLAERASICPATSNWSLQSSGWSRRSRARRSRRRCHEATTHWCSVTACASAAKWLQADLRHDDNSIYGGVGTGRIGYSIELASGWRARALAGTSFRAPTFNDLFYPGYGVSTVEPERGRSIEAGLNWTRSTQRSRDHGLSQPRRAS